MGLLRSELTKHGEAAWRDMDVEMEEGCVLKERTGTGTERALVTGQGVRHRGQLSPPGLIFLCRGEGVWTTADQTKDFFSALPMACSGGERRQTKQTTAPPGSPPSLGLSGKRLGRSLHGYRKP